MRTYDQIRHILGNAVDSAAEGWQHLLNVAQHAVTRFKPVSDTNADATAGPYKASRWALLAAEVHENDDAVCVRLEIPGMEAKDFDIRVNNQFLVVSGEKHVSREHENKHYHLVECAYGQFERWVPLPRDVDENKAKASYKNGILQVILPKSATTVHKTIKIESD